MRVCSEFIQPRLCKAHEATHAMLTGLALLAPLGCWGENSHFPHGLYRLFL